MTTIVLESWTREEALAYWRLDGNCDPIGADPTGFEQAERARAGRVRKYTRAEARARKEARWVKRRRLVDEAEPIDREQIFARDGWICQLCGEAVNRLLVHPDLMAPELDHRLPISRGGQHTEDNVQLAHRICNLRKGNRARPEARKAGCIGAGTGPGQH